MNIQCMLIQPLWKFYNYIDTYKDMLNSPCFVSKLLIEFLLHILVIGIRFSFATDVSRIKKGCDLSTVRESATGMSITGPPR